MPLKNDLTQPTVIPGQNIRSIIEGARAVSMRGEDRVDSNVNSTSSFFYDPPEVGLKSSQQLNLDWSRFENHTFFSSAEVNVNVAFDQIINGFPFDGTRREYEVFFEKLTGFEKFVFDSFPKNIGYLHFSGTQTGEDTDGTKGTWISVKDTAGGLFPDLSKNKTGKNVIDPGTSSFTIEMQLFLAERANGTQVVCQKTNGTQQGITLLLLPTASLDTCLVQFSVTSGTHHLVASTSLNKGEFTHLAATYNRIDGINRLEIYKNAQLTTVTSQSVNLLSMDIKSSPLTIGSGSAIRFGGTTYTPTQTLSGALDEFRFFHSIRTQQQLEKYARKAIFAAPELKVYFRFNEPTGTLGTTESDDINRIVLDSSGNSLHSYISDAGFSFDLRSTGSIAVPLTYEKPELSPVLFPAFTDVIDLNTRLLASATRYDELNPNLISRLVPTHYFLEGQAFDGTETEEGTLGDSYTGEGTPGSGKLGTTQLLLTFLYTWAKFFDELKLFVDSFSSLNYVDYNSTGTTPDHFLPTMLKQFGFSIPPFFVDASIEQFIDAENIQPVISTDQHSLQYIQNQILRRVLSNMLEIIRSKGTIHSVKAFLRAVGIDPDNSFRIREFGGPTKQQLLHAREAKSEPGFLLDFENGGYVVSPFLTASRIETGFPQPGGTMTQVSSYPPHGISNSQNDGLFTSGSWTYEAIYRWPKTRTVSGLTQSLARLFTTGTLADAPFCTFNLVAVTSSISTDSCYVRLFGRPTLGADLQQAPLLTLELSGCNVFDGNKWHISFGRERSDALGSRVSSSFFLRAATQEYGEIKQKWTTSSYFLVEGTSTAASQSLTNVIASASLSGSYLAIGNSAFTSSTRFLNDSTNVTSEARVTAFNGQLARVRFWTKALTETEWTEHVKNYKSLGVLDPTKNFAFETTRTGSWERLRIDASMDQDTRDTDSQGKIRLFDYSQRSFHLNGFMFPASTEVVKTTLWSYSYISPTFDEAVTNDKVRVRSYQDIANVTGNPYAQVAPVYQINPSESPTDDTRFSIEFSVIDALNRDIIGIFATLDTLDNAIGNPELVFSPDYPTLESLRNTYFNRLTDQVNIKAFFEAFRWFESSIGNFIEQLIPRKTRFFGTNFVIESHMLERPKLEYSHTDIYLSEAQRHTMKDTLLLQRVAGSLKRY